MFSGYILWDLAVVVMMMVVVDMGKHNMQNVCG
jgi:hypothetical protein